MKKILFAFVFCFIFTHVFAEKVIVVYKPDKSVAVIHPAYKAQKQGESETDFLERVRNDNLELKDLPFDMVDKTEIPQTREDRQAWEGEKGKGIKVNQQKANDLKQAKAKKVQDKNNAISKLEELGFTEDQLKALDIK